MNLKEYKKIVKKHSKKENIFLNTFISFLIGGLMGIIGQVFIVFIKERFSLTISECYMYLMIFYVVISSILTGFGFFDKAVEFSKCGLIVPTTGFAHAMTASAIDNESSGLIKGIGSNIFKLTGSVILYGLVSAMVLALLKGVLI